MKKAVLLVLSALCLVQSYAQNASESLLKELLKYRLSLDYEYVISGVTEITVQGNALIQKDCFRMEGAGLLVLCDGKAIWTIDLDGKEAYVENAGPMDYKKYLLDLAWEEDKLVGSIGVPTTGDIINFTLFNIEKSPESGDLSLFSPPQDFFNDGSDWIITDLR